MTGIRKTVTQAVFFILLLAAALVMTTDFTKLHAASHDVWSGTCTVTVEPGDTLWQIAARYSDDQQDIRDVIRATKQRNRLASAALHPGQTLVVPAPGAAAQNKQCAGLLSASRGK